MTHTAIDCLTHSVIDRARLSMKRCSLLHFSKLLCFATNVCLVLPYNTIMAAFIPFTISLYCSLFVHSSLHLLAQVTSHCTLFYLDLTIFFLGQPVALLTHSILVTSSYSKAPYVHCPSHHYSSHFTQYPSPLLAHKCCDSINLFYYSF